MRSLDYALWEDHGSFKAKYKGVYLFIPFKNPIICLYFFYWLIILYYLFLNPNLLHKINVSNKTLTLYISQKCIKYTYIHMHTTFVNLILSCDETNGKNCSYVQSKKTRSIHVSDFMLLLSISLGSLH